MVEHVHALDHVSKIRSPNRNGSPSAQRRSLPIRSRASIAVSYAMAGPIACVARRRGAREQGTVPTLSPLFRPAQAAAAESSLVSYHMAPLVAEQIAAALMEVEPGRMRSCTGTPTQTSAPTCGGGCRSMHAPTPALGSPCDHV